MPACQAIAVRLVDPHQLGTGISTLLLLADVGIGLGPVLLGLVIQATNHSTMYLLLALAVLVAAVLYHFVHGRLPVAQPGHRS
ncbi:MFS transporter [Luteococcus sp. OSA5]|uniref:MFS transporter n=1 Tax=Luteococcus sp. OSA5 TaxID=3401630 RepID=UPI003B427F7B